MDSKVDKDTVNKVAEIARITLSEEEVEEFSKDMESVLEAFKDLQKLDTVKVKPKVGKDAGFADVKPTKWKDVSSQSFKDVRPTFQPIETKNVMRDDEIEASLSQVDALKNAEQKERGYFKGPKAV